MKNSRCLIAVILLLILTLTGCSSEEPTTEETSAVTMEEFLGRWDVTVKSQNGEFPSWFEFSSENGQPAGRFVGRVGSARPIQQITIDGNKITFSLPVQYESHPEDMSFSGVMEGNRITGTTNGEDGSVLSWTAVPAPDLIREVEWGEPLEIFNGKDLTGWHVRSEDVENQWIVQDGILFNQAQGVDLITDEKVQDFRLQLEFMYPEKSNSGIYLRGRYEVQIQDDFGKEPHSLFIGGVYGFLTPSINAGKPANQWQTYDITLVGRKVTIILNGEKVIDNEIIPGITGGALDSNEGDPGPIMLQGDHGQISFRNIILTPAVN